MTLVQFMSDLICTHPNILTLNLTYDVYYFGTHFCNLRSQGTKRPVNVSKKCIRIGCFTFDNGIFAMIFSSAVYYLFKHVKVYFIYRFLYVMVTEINTIAIVNQKLRICRINKKTVKNEEMKIKLTVQENKTDFEIQNIHTYINFKM